VSKLKVVKDINEALACERCGSYITDTIKLERIFRAFKGHDIST